MRRTTVQEAYEPLAAEESDKLLDQEAVVKAIRQVENNGIVFPDEIDKIAGREVAPAPTCRARACSATCCRSSRAPRSRRNTVR